MKAPQLSVFNYSFQNQSEDAVDIYVDGYIVDADTKELLEAYWGDETSTSFKSFREQVPANVKTINLYVNSGGGHVGDAMAIHDYLKEKERNGVSVNRIGRGIVASAATYLVMGENSEMSENSWFMIHNVSGFAYGDVNQVENQARTLRKFNDRIIEFYSNETGLSQTVISNMMNKESWLTAQECKDKGFVKKVSGQVNFKNSIKPENWQFQNTAVLNAYNSFTKIQNSSTMELNLQSINDAIKNGFEGLLTKLNLKKDDQSVVDATTEFSNTLVEAIKNAIPKDGGVTEETIQNLVNTAVANSLKELPESVTNAINTAVTNATSGFATKDDVKNIATKKDVDDAITNLTDSIVEKLGGPTNTEKDKDKDKQNKGMRVIKNKFTDAVLWNEN